MTFHVPNQRNPSGQNVRQRSARHPQIGRELRGQVGLTFSRRSLQCGSVELLSRYSIRHAYPEVRLNLRCLSGCVLSRRGLPSCDECQDPSTGSIAAKV